MEHDDRKRGAKSKARPKVVPQSGPSRRRGRPRRTEVEPKQMAALRMLMEGKTHKEIAEALGVDGRTIGRWLQEPAVQREMAVLLGSASTEISAQMISVTPEVFATFRELLHSENEGVRARMVIWYLDRMIAMGRQLEGDARILAPLPSSLSSLLEAAPEPEGGEVA